MDKENQDSPSDKPQSPIEVPREKISGEILSALIEEFILREGTDYGAVEVSLAAKKQQVEKQIFKDQIKIIFDFETQTATLVTTDEFKRKFSD
jgi:hypothetical protein